MITYMISQEGARLKQFMELIGLNQYELAPIVKKKQSDISRYITGDRKIPLSVVKILHMQFKMSYSWFFHGDLPMRVKELEQKRIISDLSDIMATISMMMASQDKMRDEMIKLHRIIADKTGTQKGHTNS
jgi:hypothetical protein